MAIQEPKIQAPQKHPLLRLQRTDNQPYKFHIKIPCGISRMHFTHESVEKILQL